VPHDWPVWVVDWNLPEKQRVTLDNNLMRILDEAEPPRLVFASNDPPKEIFAAKEVSAEDLAQVKDWFAYLGLNRAPRE